jgi:hypothetical protein
VADFTFVSILKKVVPYRSRVLFRVVSRRAEEAFASALAVATLVLISRPVQVLLDPFVLCLPVTPFRLENTGSPGTMRWKCGAGPIEGSEVTISKAELCHEVRVIHLGCEGCVKEVIRYCVAPVTVGVELVSGRLPAKVFEMLPDIDGH